MFIFQELSPKPSSIYFFCHVSTTLPFLTSTYVQFSTYHTSTKLSLLYISSLMAKRCPFKAAV